MIFDICLGRIGLMRNGCQIISWLGLLLLLTEWVRVQCTFHNKWLNVLWMSVAHSRLSWWTNGHTTSHTHTQIRNHKQTFTPFPFFPTPNSPPPNATALPLALSLSFSLPLFPSLSSNHPYVFVTHLKLENIFTRKIGLVPMPMIRCCVFIYLFAVGSIMKCILLIFSSILHSL